MTRLTTPPQGPFPLDEALSLVKSGEPVVLDREGRPLAALITMEDLGLLERLIEEAEDRIDLAAAERAMDEIEAGRSETIPWEDVKARLNALRG